MAHEQWVIDASMSVQNGQFCFCPIEGDINSEFCVVTGLNSNVPLNGGKLVAIWHPDGQEAVEQFCREHANLLASKYWEHKPMRHHYADICSRISETPRWYDEHAVPRYCAFSPREVADVYAVEVALVGIKCQSCGHPYRVAFSWQRHALGRNEDGTVWLKNQPPIDPTTLHYGDPPNGCCASGATMNSELQRVLEWWRRVDFKWLRVPENEVDIACEWADPGVSA